MTLPNPEFHLSKDLFLCLPALYALAFALAVGVTHRHILPMKQRLGIMTFAAMSVFAVSFQIEALVFVAVTLGTLSAVGGHALTAGLTVTLLGLWFPRLRVPSLAVWRARCVQTGVDWRGRPTTSTLSMMGLKPPPAVAGTATTVEDADESDAARIFQMTEELCRMVSTTPDTSDRESAPKRSGAPWG